MGPGARSLSRRIEIISFPCRPDNVETTVMNWSGKSSADRSPCRVNNTLVGSSPPPWGPPIASLLVLPVRDDVTAGRGEELEAIIQGCRLVPTGPSLHQTGTDARTLSRHLCLGAVYEHGVLSLGDHPALHFL